MLILQLSRIARMVAGALGRILSRPVSRHRSSRLAGLDRRILSDVGIGLGEILSLPRNVESLRRPPHV